MQVMFLVLFAVSLILFSLVVREGVGMMPYLLGGEVLPLGAVGRGAFWLVLFALSFFGTGLYLYEREREDGEARPIRRADEE